MLTTDPIADFLTRIRNAIKARKKYVDIPSSRLKEGLAEILKANKYIRDYNVIEDNKQNILRIHLQYINGIPSITGLKKVSKPGLRIYAGKDEIPKIMNGLGISIISTSKGLMTDKQARKESVGGELICQVW